ncbi:hypothetical protein C9890_0010, partial [Perkinsus sp. BL_2016]
MFEKIKVENPDCGVFRRATRFVKFFATQRCIYSNAIGYVGGVSWALMWEWEENAVVQLGPIVDAPLTQIPRERQSQYREWNNTKYPSDASNPFPVITPIFPCHNTAYNVTESQKWCMLQEIGRGWKLLKPITDTMLTAFSDHPGQLLTQSVISDLRRTLQEVCEEYPFFTAFRKY